ncbi:hypothetical protein A8B75_17640 [Sphingomonadales bacterium EhC05]|nr:hypothetical protein A8B75_17640 [Sphingomonadales bacterium EhC05]
MTRHIPLQTYLPAHVAGWIREAAKTLDLTVSVIMRDIIMAAFRDEQNRRDGTPDTDNLDRQSVFISIALDALLTAHTDKKLRDRVFEDYAQRIDDLGLAETSENGGRHEA